MTAVECAIILRAAVEELLVAARILADDAVVTRRRRYRFRTYDDWSVVFVLLAPGCARVLPVTTTALTRNSFIANEAIDVLIRTVRVPTTSSPALHFRAFTARTPHCHTAAGAGQQSSGRRLAGAAVA